MKLEEFMVVCTRTSRQQESVGTTIARITEVVGDCYKGLLLDWSRKIPPEKLRYLAGTSSEYQRHVVDRLAAGDTDPLRHTAQSVFVYDTIAFREVLSRLHRAAGHARAESAYLVPLLGTRRPKVNWAADRVLTLDLLRRAASDVRGLIEPLPIIGPGRERAPRARAQTECRAGFHSPAALGLVGKNARNVPRLKPEHHPTAVQRRRAVELCKEIEAVANSTLKVARKKLGHPDRDQVVQPHGRPTRRVITHSEPDADAVLSVWLVERYLFADEPVVILFLNRSRVLGAVREGDCLTDVGNTYDPDRHWFDHKPPAFPSRHDSCAAKLVCEYLLRTGHQVGHLESIVRATYAGDSTRNRGRYATEYSESRERGLHAVLKRAQQEGLSDADTYRAAREWLDAEDRRLRTGPVRS